MERKDESSSDYAYDVTSSERNSSRTRRGFLKQTAATSIVGVVGMAGMTEGVSAADSSNDVETQAANRITIRGIADRTRYSIYSTRNIWGGDSGGAGPDFSFEYPQGVNYEGTTYHYGIDGTIYADNVDVFRFNGYVAVPDTAGITYTVEDL